MSMVEQEVYAYTPESINQQLLLGRSREELAEAYGHKSWRSLDMYMRRNGYNWNGNRQVYELEGNSVDIGKTEPTGTMKLLQVLKLFNEGKDSKEVARELGFKNHLALAEYMKEKHYAWNHNSQRYEQDSGNISAAAEEIVQENALPALTGNSEVIQFINEHKDRLFELLESEERSLPRYRLPGYRISKCINLSHKLDLLLKNFCEEHHITQRELVEIGVIETLKRYGYRAEVKGVIGNI